MLFVISGPSGAGKTTLVRRVLIDLDNVEFSVSHTTRERRKVEIEGRDYYFVSKEEFQRLIKEDRLAEWALVHSNYYGTSKTEIEKKRMRGDLILDIDVQGARQIRERFSESVFVFIMPPPFLELKKRLESRGLESEVSIKERLETACREIRQYSLFDYIVINDDLDMAVLELESIIRCTRSCLALREKEVLAILKSFEENKEG